jgi:hypothetical protein
MRSFRGVAFATLVVTLSCGCSLPGEADWTLRIENSTEPAWYLRVRNFIGESDGLTRVTLVSGGASGRAIEWLGAKDVEIEVLDTDCNLVGTFTPRGGPEVAVEEIPGLTGHVEPWSRRTYDEQSEMPYTSECGGFLYL